MLPILLKTLPFFALIGVGYWAGRVRIFPPEAVAWLTKFVFYFALSAMLFRFAANLSLAEIFDLPFVLAYLSATTLVYLIAMGVALFRKRGLEEAAMEAQCATSGNTGFLGVPMLVVLLGPAAAGPVLMVLTVDMVVFSSLITLIITGARGGALGLHTLRTLAVGWFRNPMVVSIVLGLIWSGLALPVPAPVNEFLALLGGAATPGALFAIGASLAGRGAERLGVAGWLSFAKLVLHPLAVAIAALWLFPVDRAAAGVMIAAASLPVAGNVYILAQHYGVAPQRVSTAILISTAVSILTVTAVIAWITG
ncbi:AEC family transporter [Gemmobacter fulvus]|uniref:AEC family transporter n=1 Tax=Gemmobacter fulvus TaxID=2840474 RepID=A0A975P920_9RHOB|nr:AEC family transporter [Gemmobacter fulvus]MBT9244791.1 AEC family transporter [Gemmobacter fulvus]QWK91632.1 AEC family transporter [Gemmobacter fulvus]